MYSRLPPEMMSWPLPSVAVKVLSFRSTTEDFRVFSTSWATWLRFSCWLGLEVTPLNRRSWLAMDTRGARQSLAPLFRSL